MRRLSFILAALLPWSVPAPVQAKLLAILEYVDSVHGSNTGNCQVQASPCATIQYAVDQAPPNAQTTIYIAAKSTFSEAVNISHFSDVILVGDPTNYTVTFNVVGGAGACGITVEDHAILQEQGLTFVASDNNQKPTCGRQAVVLDLWNNHYGLNAYKFSSIYAAIGPGTIVNTSGDSYLDQSTSGPAFLMDNGKLTLGGTIHMNCGGTFSPFLEAVEYAVIDVTGASFTYLGGCGPSGVIGVPYNIDNSQLTKGQVVLPGNGTPSVTHNGVVE